MDVASPVFISEAVIVGGSVADGVAVGDGESVASGEEINSADSEAMRLFVGVGVSEGRNDGTPEVCGSGVLVIVADSVAV